MTRWMNSLLMAGLMLAAHSGQIALAEHAYAQFGDIKYKAGFTHFDTANPKAPKGGTLTLVPNSRASNFDKYNPFTLKGEHPPGLMSEGQEASLVFETLLTSNFEEPTTAYGFLAEDVAVAKDGFSAVFRLNPLARFSNGDAVLAKDVKHSFDMQSSKLVSPRVKVLFEDVKAITVLGDRLVRFDFKKSDRVMPLVAGSLQIFSHKWGAGKPFDQIVTDVPIGSGPYVVGAVDFGKTMVYERDKNYWAKDLPARLGNYNFDRIVYKIYSDETVRLEAFKAGEFDLIEENTARRWAREYKGRQFASGVHKTEAIPNRHVASYQGYAFNLRRPVFQDKRVRQAIALAQDFDWLNRQFFYNQYKRIQGYFSDETYTARGLPSKDELKFLEPLRSKLAAEILDGPVPSQPTTLAPSSLRSNLRQAKDLLAEAGWKIEGGVLRDKSGKPMVIEFLFDQPSYARILTPFQKNLEKLGIQLKFRVVDYALLKKRLDGFDFDMTSIALGSSSTPGTDLKDLFSSESAARNGNLNYWGITDPAVDALLEHIVKANTRADLNGAVRALDRVLQHGAYSIPNWYSPNFRMGYAAKKFERPQQMPEYFGVRTWILSNWWSK